MSLDAGKPTAKLIVISAPSGTGKTTLCARLLKEVPNLILSISSTTRAPRGLEKHGEHYLFMKQTDFEQGIQEGQFAEWAQVHGNFYGTSRSMVEQNLSIGRSVLLDIDVQGAESLRRAFPDQTFSVFVAPPSLEVLESRLRSRGTDGEEAIARRMLNAREEMAEAPRFHARIINDDFETAYAHLKLLIDGQLSGGSV